MENKKITGIIWIAVVVTVFTALAITLVYDITLNTGDMHKTLTNVYKFSGPHIIELIFDSTSNLLLIIASIRLFYLLDKKRTALYGSLWFIISGIIMIIHNMGNFAVTWIARDYYHSTGMEAEIFKAVGKGILLTAKWGVTLASTFFVLGVATYCIVLLSKSKWLARFGIIAAILAIPALTIGWLGPQYELMSYRLWGPMLIWQIYFGVHLIFSKK